MSAEKQRWPRNTALAVADDLVRRLEPFCERIIIAGSLRRQKPDVGDVEILYISRLEERPEDFFSTRLVSLADEEISRMLSDGTLTQRLSKTGSPAWGLKNKLALHHSGMPVDFFSTIPDAWWNYLVCRTGPAESNTRIASRAQSQGYQWNPYSRGFTRLSDGAQNRMNSEREVFEFVGLPYHEPEDRR